MRPLGAMLDGDVADVEIAALLTALAQRGETVDEVTGVVMALRERLMPLPVTDAERAELVDTCGTGGDGSGTFNISTRRRWWLPRRARRWRSTAIVR